jgi:hypothetical protein
LADKEEVRKVLENVIHTYDFIPYDYAQDQSTGELVRVYKYNYEIAEALWGEHSEELFD